MNLPANPTSVGNVRDDLAPQNDAGLAPATSTPDALPSVGAGEPPELDLVTEQGVRAYLAETPWASTDISPLAGGTANYVFRVTVLTAYRGQTTVVFKHAKPYVKDNQEIAFGRERQVRACVRCAGPEMLFIAFSLSFLLVWFVIG